MPIVRVTNLVLDFDIYPRSQVDPLHVAGIVQAMESGVVMPAVIAERGTRRVVDGFHRVTAALKKDGAEAGIQVNYRVYDNEAALFREAMALNASHGRNLTTFDRTRCIVRGEELGLTREEISTAVNITLERANNLILDRVAGDGLVLKRTMRHFAGLTMTEDQRRANLKMGGMDQSFYINQVIALLETDSMDFSRMAVREGLERLTALLLRLQVPV